jgi:hypothetical protein
MNTYLAVTWRNYPEVGHHGHVITDASADPAEPLPTSAPSARLRTSVRTSVRTVERLMASGEPPAIRLGRRTVGFAPTDLDALIQRRRG